MTYLFREIARFIFAVFSHWQTWLSGGGLGGFIVVAVGITEKLLAKSLPKKHYIYIFLISFFLCSCFLAWVDRDKDFEKVSQEKAQQHDSDVVDLQIARSAFTELKAQCQYQAGVTDTLSKQNRDQQTLIAGCQQDAIRAMTPQALEVVPYRFPTDSTSQDPANPGKVTTFLLLTNRDVSPSLIQVNCDQKFTSIGVNTVKSPVGTGAGYSTGVQSMPVSTPAFSPTNPLVLTVFHKQEKMYCYFALR